MCGIAGIVGTGAGSLRSRSEAMGATLARRGPDAHATLPFTNCVLAHTRLSILDLATGDQPMRDGTTAVTFNGEIYNFANVRGTLTRKGHGFWSAPLGRGGLYHRNHLCPPGGVAAPQDLFGRLQRLHQRAALFPSGRGGPRHRPYDLAGGWRGAAELESVTAYLDEPHADTSNVAQSLVSRLAATRVKVALCGDGGDVVFLGYEWYWRHRQAGKRAGLRQLLLSSPYGDYSSAVQAFKCDSIEQLWGGRRPDPLPATPPGLPGTRGGVRAINQFDLRMYLPGQLLVKADRAGMMHSLEVRTPLLDRALAEFVVNLPASFKTVGRRGKLTLKDLLRPLFPAQFVDRPKQEFGAPVQDWMRTICRPLMHDLLDPLDATVYSYLDRAFVQGLMRRFESGADGSDYRRLWGLVVLELWCRHHRSPRGRNS